MIGWIAVGFLSGVACDNLFALIAGYYFAKRNAEDFEEWRKRYGISKDKLQR